MDTWRDVYGHVFSAHEPWAVNGTSMDTFAEGIRHMRKPDGVGGGERGANLQRANFNCKCFGINQAVIEERTGGATYAEDVKLFAIGGCDRLAGRCEHHWIQPTWGVTTRLE